MRTAFDAAKARFTPGLAVVINPHVLNTAWQVAVASGAIPRVVDLCRYRDSDDDPMICVCCPCIGGAIAGWFLPDDLVVRA